MPKVRFFVLILRVEKQTNKTKQKTKQNAYEPRHDKTNKMAVRPANTQQNGYAPNLISLRCPHEESLGP